ncbi:MAG: ATP-binding protein [Spirochaetota bacterium]|nr:ATP-binding protein [Spirochaetota bacterium]
MSDSDALFEFSTDDTLAGFRLKRLEVYNWGTFHNRIWELNLDGLNGLLTGDIGSGKSTLVDAVTTLLVPANKVSYNKAAGAGYKERSLRSYVLGYYKSERSDGGYSAKPVALRERNTYSVILGSFFNEGYEQTVTLAQVFWQKESVGQPTRFYIVADKDLSIREHFSNFGSDISRLKKEIKNLDHVEPPFDTFPPYGAAFRRRFGLQSDQALELFHQTVSLKSVGNLTGFVREHMLEAFDTAPRIEELINHFEDLNRSHEAVLKAKSQIGRLQPLSEKIVKLDSIEKERIKMRFSREGLSPFFASEKADLLLRRINKQNEEVSKKKIKEGEVSFKRGSLQKERDEVRQAVAENGGDRLESMKSEKKASEEEKAKRLLKFEDYQGLCKSLELPQIKDADGFIDNRNNAKNLLKNARKRSANLLNSRTEQEVLIKGLKEKHSIISEEVESLKKRRSNISLKQIHIRDDLCTALELSPKELPFAGELIMIKEEDSSWEGAAERVLHNFALSLLVPAAHYREVTEWVDRTHLRGRLVYYKVNEEEAAFIHQKDAAALTSKLRVKPDSPFRDWLEDQLHRRFDYTCCRNLGEFRKVRKGLTSSGQIKGSQSRHEKDDRHDINDRSRYVLGWTNLEKIQALTIKRKDLEDSMAEIAGVINVIHRDLETIDKEKESLNRIEFYNDYEEINWHPSAVRIEYLNSEILKLEKSSNKLKLLNESLLRLDAELQLVEKNLEKVRADITTLNERNRAAQEQLELEEGIVSDSNLDIEELRIVVKPLADEALGDTQLTIANCDKQQQRVREWLQVKIDALDKRVKTLSVSIVTIMADFRSDYPAETRDFDATLESGSDFITFLNKLKADDLPKYEERFKRQLNENTIRGIAGFQAQLNKEFRQIEERVAHINKSMAAIEYNKDRYIKLETLPSNDSDIRGFRQELKSCTEGSFASTDNEQYTEEKFLQVKTIVNRFKGREGTSDLDKKWTQKVTDVRNWFAFAASERWVEDDSEYEHYTDSGGKSGGQKEKLAYTVLAASLAYQFGLEWGEVRSRSFRFVVIDEAFGRGSDESARFGLELFKQLNLQLLIITPLQKIHIIEPYVSTVGFVHNEEGKYSLLRSITIEEYKTEKEQSGKVDL